MAVEHQLEELEAAVVHPHEQMSLSEHSDDSEIPLSMHKYPGKTYCACSCSFQCNNCLNNIEARPDSCSHASATATLLLISPMPCSSCPSHPRLKPCKHLCDSNRAELPQAVFLRCDPEHCSCSSCDMLQHICGQNRSDDALTL